MRDLYHIYFLDSGRISVPGLNTKNVKRMALWVYKTVIATTRK